MKNGLLDSQKEVKTVKNIRNDRKGVLKISTNTEKGYEGSVKRSKGNKKCQVIKKVPKRV